MFSIVVTKFGTKTLALFSGWVPHMILIVWDLGSPSVVVFSKIKVVTKMKRGFFIFGMSSNLSCIFSCTELIHRNSSSFSRSTFFAAFVEDEEKVVEDMTVK